MHEHTHVQHINTLLLCPIIAHTHTKKGIFSLCPWHTHIQYRHCGPTTGSGLDDIIVGSDWTGEDDTLNKPVQLKVVKVQRMLQQLGARTIRDGENPLREKRGSREEWVWAAYRHSFRSSNHPSCQNSTQPEFRSLTELREIRERAIRGARQRIRALGCETKSDRTGQMWWVEVDRVTGPLQNMHICESRQVMCLFDLKSFDMKWHNLIILGVYCLISLACGLTIA